jgi:predicted  nucleic acid-binding Zn-ribbon protein
MMQYQIDDLHSQIEALRRESAEWSRKAYVLERDASDLRREHDARKQRLVNAESRVEILERALRDAMQTLETTEPGVSTDCEAVNPDLVTLYWDLDRAVRS